MAPPTKRRFECRSTFYLKDGEILAPGSVVDEAAMSADALEYFQADGRLVPTDKPLNRIAPEGTTVLGTVIDAGKPGED